MPKAVAVLKLHDGTDMTTTPIRLNYGTGSVPTRPTTTRPVEWQGTSNPSANMSTGDTWLPT